MKVQQLHKEHLEWLSEIKFWQEEIIFLKNICQKHCGDKQVPAKIYFADLFNQLDHHSRLLHNMESQINSHENFIKEYLNSQLIQDLDDQNITDHDHNRWHILQIAKSLKQLKSKIFKLLESTLEPGE
ncbi:MAG: hypothetical protein ACNS62_01220 [Candidatus Cyclobacteriaceae bacterium M3_2C_046]